MEVDLALQQAVIVVQEAPAPRWRQAVQGRQVEEGTGLGKQHVHEKTAAGGQQGEIVLLGGREADGMDRTRGLLPSGFTTQSRRRPPGSLEQPSIRASAVSR
jgi:hypothetical protein